MLKTRLQVQSPASQRHYYGIGGKLIYPGKGYESALKGDRPERFAPYALESEPISKHLVICTTLLKPHRPALHIK